jgi:ATP-dependent DNA helicase DinG
VKITEQTILDAFSDKGCFFQHDPTFEPRSVQKSMAIAVNQAIQSNEHLLIEAGTGVGKTFAYLLPAILSKKKLVISTGTKNLQEQLFKRDVPYVLNVLKQTPKIAILKGRKNYLCHYRLENALTSGYLPGVKSTQQLSFVHDWKNKTLSGDLDDLDDLPENTKLIPYITSNVDNCLAQECPFIRECYLFLAREKAKKADILIINHHLLLADLVLKEDGFGELLPETDIFIIDEAHHLPEIAYDFYSESLTSYQLIDICKMIELEYRTKVTDCRDLLSASERVTKAMNIFRLTLPPFDSKEEWNNAKVRDKIASQEALDDLFKKMEILLNVLKINRSRTQVIDACFKRIEKCCLILKRFVQKSIEETEINWYETHHTRFRLNSTPLDIAQLFQKSRMAHNQSSWIMTSATLSVHQTFSHYSRSLGWKDLKALELPSIFDYKQQCLLYVPRYLPSPQENEYTQKMMKHILPLLIKNSGRAFLLLTSHKALQEAAKYLREHPHFTCLVQGDENKTLLLKRFIHEKNAVLIATGSFWEGIDVKGKDLSLVIIDKLPFTSPDDPILNAKMRKAKQDGKHPFFDLQMPSAVLALKQGVGRLIRSIHDKGVICICDPRLVGKAYSQTFIQSLPPMKRTRNMHTVFDFLDQ